MASNFRIGPYDPCPCGSGEKYKFCCAAKAREDRHGEYPCGVVAYFGPDDKTVTRIAAGIFVSESAAPVLRTWLGAEVASDRNVGAEIKQFFAQNGVKTVKFGNGISGCPHEEGIDYPKGEECPLCPFWAGKQGMAPIQAGEEPWIREITEKLAPAITLLPPDEASMAKSASNAVGTFERVGAILDDDEKKLDFARAVDKLYAHLKAKLHLPCQVTGIGDFQWEECHVMTAHLPGDYKKLRKTHPSYTDRYLLLEISRGPRSEWMMFDDDICAHVRRIKDGREFVLGLGELKATDAASSEYQLLGDYAVWFVNSL